MPAPGTTTGNTSFKKDNKKLLAANQSDPSVAEKNRSGRVKLVWSGIVSALTELYAKNRTLEENRLNQKSNTEGVNLAIVDYLSSPHGNIAIACF